MPPGTHHPSASLQGGHVCNLVIHEGSLKEEIQVNLDVFEHDIKPGSMMAMSVLRPSGENSTPSQVEPKHRQLFLVKDMAVELKTRHPNTEVYVTRQFADVCGIKKACQVLLTPVDPHAPDVKASHVELSFRDQYLSRADMWRLTVAELANKIVYKGQQLLFMDTIKCQITAVYVDGKKVQSAFFGRDSRPIFRSESARFVILIQMSREMWEFAADSSCEILFHKCVDGFLPALFKKWVALNVKHLVSIVLFARVEYENVLGLELDLPARFFNGHQPTGLRRPYKDFYQVVVSDMASGEWTTILRRLKRSLDPFYRDISNYHLEPEQPDPAESPCAPISEESPCLSPKTPSFLGVKARPSIAAAGNILEAISMTSSRFARDHIDRDLTRTGISVAVITAGPGVFEVGYDNLLKTTEALVSNGIAIDMVCMQKMPLHSVPLFRYLNPLSYTREEHLHPTIGVDQCEWCYAIPQWLHVSYWTGTSEDSICYQGIALAPSDPTNTDRYGCRMYNLQMRSVPPPYNTEIACLQSDRDYPRHAHEYELPVTAELPDKTSVTRHLRPQNLVYPHIEGLPTIESDRLDTTAGHSMWKMLREYDHLRAKVFVHSLPDSSEHENQVTDSYTPSIQRLVFPNNLVFGSSPLVRARPTRTATALPDIARATTPEISSKPSPATRKISFGVRGFGIAKPEASIAEIKTENAVVTIPSMPKDISATTAYLTPSQALHGSASPQIARRPELQQSLTTPPIPALSSNLAANTRGLSSTNPGFVLHRYNHEPGLASQDAVRTEDMQKPHNKRFRASVVSEQEESISTSARFFSPWLNPVNPTNPNACEVDMVRLLSRWQHAYPQLPDMCLVKWKSLCCPAAVPLTTEFFPSKTQFENEYTCQPYRIDPTLEDDMAEVPKGRDDFLRELVGLRLLQGFQIVVGHAVEEIFGRKALTTCDMFSYSTAAVDGASIFLTAGPMIHQLSCVNNTEVEVNIYTRNSEGLSEATTTYHPALRTLLEKKYGRICVELISPKIERNWNFIDVYLTGHFQDMSSLLPLRTARFVFIPDSPPSPPAHRTGTGDSEEETRLEGITKLGLRWQKQRWIPPAERTFAAHKANTPKPLDIVYRTEDPSTVISVELENLLENLDGGKTELINNEKFRSDDFNIAALVDAIQQPVEKGGIRMKNRRWHLRLHYNCFIGSDMTTWLLENFEDLETREEAEAFGNRLMLTGGDDKKRGIFVHVEKRHPFRDGQYFYQIAPEYAKPHAGQQSWFNSLIRAEAATSASPMVTESSAETKRAQASRLPSRPVSTQGTLGQLSPITGMETPSVLIHSKCKPTVVLSKLIRYDVDSRKKSGRTELINLHYDRLHNPDNCYHIRIEWVNATPKLIEDAIESWARMVSQYGLRLVEVPIAEASRITEQNPFRRPFKIVLAVPPPAYTEVYYDTMSLAPRPVPLPFRWRSYYHRAILKRFDFVLDTEGTSNFPSPVVDISYSWGEPDYVYSQYIHRSGTLVAQIVDRDIILVANRLYRNRGSAGRDASQKRCVAADQTPQSAAGDRAGLTARKTNVGVPLHGPNLVASPLPTVLEQSDDTIPSNVSQEPKPTSHEATSCFNTAVHDSSGIAPEPPAWTELPPTSDISSVVRQALVAFCSNAELLEAFYHELNESMTGPGGGPPGTGTTTLTAAIQATAATATTPTTTHTTMGISSGTLASMTTPASARHTMGSGTIGSATGAHTIVPEAHIPHLGLGPGVLSHGGEGSASDSPRTLGSIPLLSFGRRRSSAIDPSRAAKSAAGTPDK